MASTDTTSLDEGCSSLATDVMADNQDRQVDVSYHSKAWHAARIAQLSAERPNYDDWKEKRDAADRQAAREEEEREKAEEEYRRQLKKDRCVHASVSKSARFYITCVHLYAGMVLIFGCAFQGARAID